MQASMKSVAPFRSGFGLLCPAQWRSPLLWPRSSKLLTQKLCYMLLIDLLMSINEIDEADRHFSVSSRYIQLINQSIHCCRCQCIHALGFIYLPGPIEGIPCQGCLQTKGYHHVTYISRRLLPKIYAFIQGRHGR